MGMENGRENERRWMEAKGKKGEGKGVVPHPKQNSGCATGQTGMARHS